MSSITFIFYTRTVKKHKGAGVTWLMLPDLFQNVISFLAHILYLAVLNLFDFLLYSRFILKSNDDFPIASLLV